MYSNPTVFDRMYNLITKKRQNQDEMQILQSYDIYFGE